MPNNIITIIRCWILIWSHMVGYNRRRQQKTNQSRILVSIGLNRLKNVHQVYQMWRNMKFQQKPYVTNLLCKIKHTKTHCACPFWLRQLKDSEVNEHQQQQIKNIKKSSQATLWYAVKHAEMCSFINAMCHLHFHLYYIYF